MLGYFYLQKHLLLINKCMMHSILFHHQLIFGNSWTRADGFDWHIHHYSCYMCDLELAGQRYVPDKEGYPYCLPCYMACLAKVGMKAILFLLGYFELIFDRSILSQFDWKYTFLALHSP